MQGQCKEKKINKGKKFNSKNQFTKNDPVQQKLQ